MYFPCPNCTENGCKHHPLVTCQHCNKKYIDDSDWDGDAHSFYDCVIELKKRIVELEQKLEQAKFSLPSP